MIKLHSYESIELVQWQKLIERSTNVCFFQTPECYDFYASLSFVNPIVYAISEDDILKGLICGYITIDKRKFKNQFSQRAIIPGGVLLDNNISSDSLKRLLDYTIKQLRKKTIYIEFRNYNNYYDFIQIFKSAGFDYKEHFNYQLNLSDGYSSIKHFSKSKQRQIRIAEKRGIQLVETVDEKDILDFYSILEDLYMNKIKHPIFPIEFFYELVKTSFGKIWVVKKDKIVIGGIALAELSGKVVYEWFICGEDKKYKNCYPSVMATWAGIRYAVNRGCYRFDFMGAGEPGKNYGVRDFKAKFGGELVEHGRFLYICKPIKYTIGKFAIKILKWF